MKPEVLGRYARGPSGEVIIDVTAPRVEDLYHDFDKRAPYVRRDLDPNLAEYLRLCAEEIGRRPFAIRFTLERPADPEHEERVRQSIPSYFLYLADLERQRIRKMLRRSLVFLAVGLGLVTLAVWVNVILAANPSAGPRSVVEQVLAEGVTIAAWVAMWEALATCLVEWIPRRRAQRVCERLASAPLIVTDNQSLSEPVAPPAEPVG